MSILMKSLHPLTYQALDSLSVDKGWADIQPYMEPETVAWMAIRLEFISDSKDVFPMGKWATIQRLQELLRIEAAIQNDKDRQP